MTIVTMPRCVPWLMMLVATFGTACTPHPEAVVAPPRLAVDLPPGVEVRMNGEVLGVTPLVDREVVAGAVELEMTTACATASLHLTASPDATLTVTTGDVPTLGFAELVVHARDHHGRALEPVVSIDDRPIAGTNGRFRVPACPLRLRVDAEGLGAFIEDLVFARDVEVVRDVTLAPGSPMVRILGAPFTIGPPRRYDLEEPDEYGDRRWAFVPRYDVKVETFDIDERQVTAEEFVACNKAAKRPVCDSPRDCADAGGCPSPAAVDPPIDRADRRFVHHCTMQGVGSYSVVRGHEREPANCISHAEAELYCRWVGKRLPTDVEFEFAARSRNTDYDYPWGNAELDTLEKDKIWSSHWQLGREVCSYPASNSQQGLCDMMGDGEHVEFADIPRRRGTDLRGHPLIVEKIMGGVAFEEGVDVGNKQGETTGFRCARSVDIPSAKGLTP